MKNRAFVSWSGGKDCSLALYSFAKNPENSVSHLVHITNDSQSGNAHYIGNDLLLSQSEAMGIPLIIKGYSADSTYESTLKSIIRELKKEGVNTGIFGDIHLNEHRVWIERVCKEMEITAVFPLWKREASDILDELISSGFRTTVIAVKNQSGLSNMLGRELNDELISELKQIEGLDLCGECGEYHTFVFDSPLYGKALSVVYGESHIVSDNVTFIPITK